MEQMIQVGQRLADREDKLVGSSSRRNMMRVTSATDRGVVAGIQRLCRRSS